MGTGFERINRVLVKHGHIIDLCEDEIVLPDGRHVFYDHIEHKGAAAVVPVLDDGRILLVRQYRNSLSRYTLEIPAGGLEGRDESPMKAALRELEEETGYRAESAELLLNFRTAVAYCNEKIEIYVAKQLIQTKQRLDEDEYIDVRMYALKDIISMIYSGIIEDSKTVASILAYKDRFC